MKNNILVSIVMPAYNSEKTIKDSIESVLKQTYHNFELIIIDDCSCDNTSIIIKELQKIDKRIIYIKNDTNIGVGKSRNVGIKQSKGEWIAFLDSDDLWKNNKLEEQVIFLNDNPKVSFLYTASSFIDYKGKEMNYILNVPKKIKYKELLRQNLISCSSVLIKSNIIKNYEMPSGNIHEDFAMWLMILKDVEYAYGINSPLLVYRLHSNSKSANKFKAAIMNWNTYKFIGLNVVERFYYMLIYIYKGINKYSSIRRNIN